MNQDLIKLTVVALGIGLGSVAMAGPHERGERPDFSTLDSDGNGSLTFEELMAPIEARFAATDTDGNGSLSAEEIAAQHEARGAERVARRIERHDANGDGELTLEEMRGRRDPARMFERADANSDGVISEEEFAEMRHSRRGHGRGDGDG